MQSPSTLCTHGEAVSGVPSVVTFRQEQAMKLMTTAAKKGSMVFLSAAHAESDRMVDAGLWQRAAERRVMSNSMTFYPKQENKKTVLESSKFRLEKLLGVLHSVAGTASPYYEANFS